MSKTAAVTLAIIAIAVVVIGGWYFASNHKNNNSMNMSSSSNSSSTGSTTPTTTDAVTIQNFAFNPANITVKAGTTVTWTNKDSVAHTVTETDGQTGPNSGDVNPNSTYMFTFAKAGTYHYHCSIHTEMVGTVTVTS